MPEWIGDTIEELKKLYIETDIPSDTLIKDKTALLKFTSTLNSKCQEDFSPEEVAGQLFKIRKKGDLPTIRS